MSHTTLFEPPADETIRIDADRCDAGERLNDVNGTAFGAAQGDEALLRLRLRQGLMLVQDVLQQGWPDATGR